MNKAEQKIFLLDAQIAGINTEIIVLKTSDESRIMEVRKGLRKKVAHLAEKRKRLKKALKS